MRSCSKWFVFEVLVLLVSPLPHLTYYVNFKYYLEDQNSPQLLVIKHVEQPIQDFMLAFMFLRIYFLIKCCFNYSIYTDLFSKQLCREQGFYPGFRFILKS